MSDLLTPADLKNESIEEEMERKGTPQIPDWLNVKKQLIFYASYHTNPINIAIHMICIPLILWSTILLLSHIPLSSSNPVKVGPGLVYQNNLGVWFNAVYVAYYFALEPFAAATYLPLALLSNLTTTYLCTTPNPTSFLPGFLKNISSLNLAGLVQVSAWTSQFMGHGVAEGRAPALFDSLLQALVLAPFFSHLEFLFIFFNYNPELQASIKKGVQEDKTRRIKGKGKKLQ